MQEQDIRDRVVVGLNIALLIALAACELGRLDMPLARLFGGPDGFALREHWVLAATLHGGGRVLSWALVLVLCLGVWWPFGWLRRLALSQRLQLAVGTLAAVVIVSLVKNHNGTSCPWDLTDFGGLIPASSHWLGFLVPDGGSGRCFPAGHASAGFAFVAGYFAIRGADPRLARRWLAGALLAGFVLGLGQQVRGAHFMSHTLWSAALCWWVALALDALWRPLQRLQQGLTLYPGNPRLP